jgi:hypothetical protein
MTTIEKWAITQGTTADEFIQSAIETFYPKVMADWRLSRFFENADMDALQRHQAAFMQEAIYTYLITVLPSKNGSVYRKNKEHLMGSLTTSWAS